MNTHFADLTLGRSRWLEAGSGDPVMLLHGMGAFNSADNLADLAARLSGQFRVLVPDLPGFGLGVRTIEAGPTFELIVEHLREWMDALDLPAAAFVGHSLGGWISALLAYASPQRVRRLALVCAAGLNRDAAPGIRLTQAPPLPALRAMFEGTFGAPPADGAIVQAAAQAAHTALAQPGALTALDPLLAQMETPALRARYLLHRRLAHIRVPALVLFGQRDPVAPYPVWSAQWEATGGDPGRGSAPWLIPGARVQRLPTGHWPHLEAPGLTADALAAFLAG